MNLSVEKSNKIVRAKVAAIVDEILQRWSIDPNDNASIEDSVFHCVEDLSSVLDDLYISEYGAEILKKAGER